MRTRLLAVGGLVLFGATALGQTTPPEKLPQAPEYGVIDTIYFSIPAAAFQPDNSTTTFASDNSGRGRRWSTGSVGYLHAPLHLPQGSQVVYLEIDYLDTSMTDALFGQIADCDDVGSPCVAHPVSSGGPASCASPGFVCSGFNETTGAGGGLTSVILTSDNLFIDNFQRHYQVSVLNSIGDGTVKLGGVIVGYRLRVSPAPAVATFPNDVPTNHPFFRFIEALAAAGITSGCAPLSYCPDNPITRGEMAVFLAAALGLHWP